MAKGYVYAEITINDVNGYREYAAVAWKSISEFGGKYLVRGGEDPEVMEGQGSAQRTVILEFPTRAQALAWYNSEQYREPKGMRHRVATTRLVIMSGFDGDVGEVQQFTGR